MFRNVVVGIDEETRGRDAIALARRLAAPDAQLTFAHVHPATTAAELAAAAVAGAGAGAQIENQDPRTSYDEEALELLVQVIRESGVDAWVRWIGSPSVGAGLKTIACEIGADLLVVGSTERSRLMRSLLGNPTVDSIAEAECVVAVAPHGYAEHSHELRRVGVAYDESPASEAALRMGQTLAQALKAELSAFEVVRAPHGVLEPRRHQIDKTVRALTQARERITQHEGVEAHVAAGEPVEQLAGYSSTVDILVAGARGAGALALLIHPSTTAALTDAVRCPLLVLTRAAREREAAGGMSVGHTPA